MTYDEFLKNFYIILKRAMEFSFKARREGLLALDEVLEEEKVDNRDIFEYGMRFTIDGTDKDVIDNILTNIINQEKDNFSRTLKNIQKEAVLSIQGGHNTRILLAFINSHTDIPLNDPEFKKIIAEYNLE